MIIDIKKIEALLASDLTGYKIEKITDGVIKHQMYDRYRKGESTIDRMPLQTAVALMKIINENS
ncbi:hypothetical protein AWM75_08345 [Aerococcus urinaehominis]|uniref:Uncharacterized protein n=1 Tax=Aerococcus urinaehominis TaxID=128944 RepID=A0A0X8FMU6_9LACT|nr:hypothetical protein [Aerococcus urinaehominis]AMB99979.1 hypothetical protein AWM75_08345 [Aerococcus urinaehominis]SDM45489.1 hypothetical protein SAMN04487985_11731 [Aerococcus urinaehominis]